MSEGVVHHVLVLPDFVGIEESKEAEPNQPKLEDEDEDVGRERGIHRGIIRHGLLLTPGGHHEEDPAHEPNGPNQVQAEGHVDCNSEPKHATG